MGTVIKWTAWVIYLALGVVLWMWLVCSTNQPVRGDLITNDTVFLTYTIWLDRTDFRRNHCVPITPYQTVFVLLTKLQILCNECTGQRNNWFQISIIKTTRIIVDISLTYFSNWFKLIIHGLQIQFWKQGLNAINNRNSLAHKTV